MKKGITIIFFLILNTQAMLSQSAVAVVMHSDKCDAISSIMVAEIPDNQDNPAYKIYKEGYNLILDERWNEARQKFAEVLSKYSKSEFQDDAQYWIAYSFKHDRSHRKKAIDAYYKFIKESPESKYYDDAVADLAELKQEQSKIIKKLTVKGDAQVYVTPEGYFMKGGSQRMYVNEDGVVIGEGPESLVVDKHGITITGDGKSFRYSYGFTPRVKTLERAMKLYSGRLNRMYHKVGTTSPAPNVLGFDKDIDPDLKLKMETVYLLSESKKDDKSFRTLKGIALDFGEPRPLREVALEVLSEFEKHDVSSVYLEVAKNDTNENMQLSAIDYINQSREDKNKTVSVLINLFDILPKNRKEQRQMIFYSIADIGNDRAVDFLSAIAKQNEDYELRRDAIYYLGSIGCEKARQVLFEILKEK